MIEIAQRDGLVGPTMEQTQHNMLTRGRVEGELKPLIEEFGLGTTIYSPLGVGVLTGKYNDGIPADSAVAKGEEWMQRMVREERLAKVRQLASLADELELKLSQLAVAWCLVNPHVSTAIIGASRPEQVRENAAAVDIVDRLDEGVMDRIEAILQNRP